MKIPKFIKSIFNGFIDFDHGMNEFEEYFRVKYKSDEFIFVIKKPDIGYPHFRVYKNKISVFTYYCSIELFSAWYYKYSNIFSYEKILRSLFRCKCLPDNVVVEMERLMKTKRNDSEYTIWDIMVDDWFILNVCDRIECSRPMPDYINHLNEYTGYLSTFQDQILSIEGWFESMRNKKKGVR